MFRREFIKKFHHFCKKVFQHKKSAFKIIVILFVQTCLIYMQIIFLWCMDQVRYKVKMFYFQSYK